ncbi:MAG TPA: AsmA family protein [Rhodanobacteraceae bacterium]|nr:AsmA family protein [Rhodanobacteraceae bacterium]
MRWIVLAIVAVLVALAIALAVHIHNLLQPERFTALLENDLAAVGLTLRLQAPAEPTLFPRPGVQLQGFSLTNVGSDRPVLQAAGATIVVPWRALMHGEIAIERVDVDAPHLGLDELESLLARLPHHAGPPRLPTIATGIHMSQGTLSRNGSPLLFDFSVETGALAPGQAFRLEAAARSATGRRFTSVLAMVPSAAHDGVIDFQSLRLYLAEQQGTALQLQGQGSWRGGEDLTMQLQGTLRHRALAPLVSASTGAPADSAPTAQPPAPDAASVTDQIALNVEPARGRTPLTVSLKLDGDDAHADLRLQPTEFGRWWKRMLAAQPGQSPGSLPFTGKAEVQQLDFGWLKAKGLSIDAGPDLAPAGSATTAAPAPSTAH